VSTASLQTFPPKLRAPITAEIERQLKELVAKFAHICDEKVKWSADSLIRA
jgi:hypothetical protein